MLTRMDTGEFCVKICRIIFIKLLPSKTVRLLIHLISVSLTFISMLQTGLFIYKFEIHYLVQYGPLYLVTLYGLCCSLCLPYFSNLTMSTLEEMDTWKCESTDPKMIQNSRQVLITAAKFIVLCLCSVGVTAICFMLPSGNDKEFFFVLQIFEKFAPDFENVLTWTFRFSLIPIGIISVMSPSHCMLFTVCHFYDQLNVLLEYTEKIDTGFEKTEILDPRSQDLVKQRLLFCIKFHIHFFRAANRSVREIQKFVLPFEFVGILVMASIVTLAFTLDRSVVEEWSLRILTLTFVAFLTLAGLASGGQMVEDFSEAIFDTLLQVQWYKWNVSNRKLYLIFLMSLGKPFKINYSENISLNYNMGVQVAKSFFSAISIVNSFQNKTS